MERACVLCGALGVKGRRSCLECGGAVVEAREMAFAGVAASPASDHNGGAPVWAPSESEPGFAPVPDAANPGVMPRADLQARSQRAVTLAWVVFVGVIVLAASMIFLRQQASDGGTSSASLPVDVYAQGDGNTYRTGRSAPGCRVVRGSTGSTCRSVTAAASR
jgi:hypothetical protein